MKILVFGKTGQVALALRRQADVIALGRDQADLSDPAACAARIEVEKPDVVINAAAYTAVDKAEDEQELAAVINASAPITMAQVCARLAIPFVHISTDYVFDGSGESPWAVDAKTNPIQTYGQTKLRAEQGIVGAGGVYGIMRTSWVFSADGNNFVKTMLRLGRDRDGLSVVGDQYGGPTPADAIAVGCLAMARNLLADGSKTGVYHFAGAPDVSWADFARAIFEEAGLDVKVTVIASVDYPTPAERPKNSRLDCVSFVDAFGVERPNWREATSRIVKDANG